MSSNESLKDAFKEPMQQFISKRNFWRNPFRNIRIYPWRNFRRKCQKKYLKHSENSEKIGRIPKVIAGGVSKKVSGFSFSLGTFLNQLRRYPEGRNINKIMSSARRYVNFV